MFYCSLICSFPLFIVKNILPVQKSEVSKLSSYVIVASTLEEVFQLVGMCEFKRKSEAHHVTFCITILSCLFPHTSHVNLRRVPVHHTVISVIPTNGDPSGQVLPSQIKF